MEFPLKINVNSEAETKKLAAEFAKNIKSGQIVALNGNLGTGKTFFVKAVAESFNYEEANSPTFSIVNEYLGDKKVYHFDFYRLKDVEELYDIGFEEYLMDEDAVTFIEWAELIPEVLPSEYLQINILRLSDSARSIEIKLVQS